MSRVQYRRSAVGVQNELSRVEYRRLEYRRLEYSRLEYSRLEYRRLEYRRLERSDYYYTLGAVNPPSFASWVSHACSNISSSRSASSTPSSSVLSSDEHGVSVVSSEWCMLCSIYSTCRPASHSPQTPHPSL
jgi:hypothetical protein